MTDLQKLMIRASEIRTRLSELGGADDLGDEQRAELDVLRGEYADVERRCQALTIAGDVPEVIDGESSEGREHARLIEAASVADIFEAVIEHRSTSGATRELQTELRLNDNQVPLAMLETRATGVTPAPGNVGQNQAAIIPAVFPQSCAAWLGVDMPTVGVGEAVFPVLTTGADVGVPIENAMQDETAGMFAAEVLSPARLQAAFFYSREDRARFTGMDSALRENLSDALMDKLDQQVLAGTKGLFHGTNLDNNNVSAVTSYALYKSGLAYARVDGKWASQVGDLRVLMGSATFAHAATQYRGNNADQSVVDELMEKTGGVKVSAHVPAVASDKQNAVIRLGMRRDMVVPLWEGVTLIPDEVTLAASGQIKITAVMLHAIQIVRKAGFHKQQTQHA